MVNLSETSPAKWIDENYPELEQKYAGRYIAVAGGRIIAVGDSAGEVNAKVKLLRPKDRQVLIAQIAYGDLHA